MASSQPPEKTPPKPPPTPKALKYRKELTPLEKKIDALIFYALNQLVYDTIDNSIEQPNVTQIDPSLNFEFHLSKRLLEYELANLIDVDLSGNPHPVELFGHPVEMPPCFSQAAVGSITVFRLFKQIFEEVSKRYNLTDLRLFHRIRRMIGKIINPPVSKLPLPRENTAYTQRRVINYLTELCHLVFLIPQEYFEREGYLTDPTLSLIISLINEIAYTISLNGKFRGEKKGAITKENPDIGHMDIHGIPRISIYNLFESFIVEELAAMCSNGVKQNLPDTGDVFTLGDATLGDATLGDALIEVKSSEGGATHASVEISRKDNMGCGLIPGKQNLNYVLYKTSRNDRDVSFSKKKIQGRRPEFIEHNVCSKNRDLVNFEGIVEILNHIIQRLNSEGPLICGEIFTPRIENHKYIISLLEQEVFGDIRVLLEFIRNQYQSLLSPAAAAATLLHVHNGSLRLAALDATGPTGLPTLTATRAAAPPGSVFGSSDGHGNGFGNRSGTTTRAAPVRGPPAAPAAPPGSVFGSSDGHAKWRRSGADGHAKWRRSEADRAADAADRAADAAEAAALEAETAAANSRWTKANRVAIEAAAAAARAIEAAADAVRVGTSADDTEAVARAQDAATRAAASAERVAGLAPTDAAPASGPSPGSGSASGNDTGLWRGNPTGRGFGNKPGKNKPGKNKAYDVNEEKDYFKLYLKYKNKYLQLKNM
jgi:hypothetical protein